MERKGTIGWVLLAVVIFAAAASLYGMMRKRFSTGTTYPALSTLRADPLGARAIYEALDALPGVDSERNFRQTKHLLGAPGKTLFVLNVSHRAFDLQELLEGDPITRFAVDGGRVVITVDGHSRNTLDRSLERAIESMDEARKKKDEEGTDDGADEKSDSETLDDSATKKSNKVQKPKKDKSPNSPKVAKDENGEEAEKDTDAEKNDEEESGSTSRHRPSLAEALKLEVDPRDFRLSAKGGAELTIPPSSALSVIPMPDWFSDTTLVPTVDENDETSGNLWEPLAFRSDRAMIAQRRIGTGSIVVCSDSYFMTNEALWKGAHPEFLLWLTGGAPTIIFDERHLGLGMGDDPGIMNLARRYHMHGLFIGGIVLFALFVWRNSSSLIPHDEAADLGITKGGVVAGEGASAGLISMLRRGVPRNTLISKCLESWLSTPASVKRTPEKRKEAAREALRLALEDPSQRKDIVSQYQKLTHILHDTPPPANTPPSS